MNIVAQGQEAGRLLQHDDRPLRLLGHRVRLQAAVPAAREGEVPELTKIASRGTEPALQYATDEDAAVVGPRSAGQRFDLGKDPIEFARWRAS